jgi:hypothetical protein
LIGLFFCFPQNVSIPWHILLNHANIAHFAFRELSSRLLSQNSLNKKKQVYQGPTNRVPMGQNKKKNEGGPRQEVNFCRPLGWVQEGDFRQNRALGVCVLRRSVLDENVQARSRNCHPLGQGNKVHPTGRQLA